MLPALLPVFRGAISAGAAELEATKPEVGPEVGPEVRPETAGGQRHHDQQRASGIRRRTGHPVLLPSAPSEKPERRLLPVT